MNIVFKRPDGGVSVVHLTDEAESSAAEEKKLRERGSIPADWVAVGQGVALPQERTFRNAWGHDGAAVMVRMPQARDVWRDKMRAVRGPMLAALDVEYQKADEQANAGKKTAISKQKQALRDVTIMPEIDAAETPEALKAVWPAILGAVPA